MNTIQCWITREKEPDQSGNEYYLHWGQPRYEDHDNEGDLYWYSNGQEAALCPQEIYGLNPGECTEWVMVKKGDFEELQAKVKELQSIQTIKNSRPKGISA